MLLVELENEHKVVVWILSKRNGGRNIRVKAYVYVTLALCNPFKVSQTNCLPVVKEKKVSAPFFKKREFWMNIKWNLTGHVCQLAIISTFPR